MPVLPAPPGPGDTDRDPVVDLVRALAIARVILWHAFPSTWMTFFAAMPILFFVAGSLLVRSGRRTPPRQLLVRRLRRLLPPVWLYGAVLLAACAVHAHLRVGSSDAAGMPARDLGSWVLPVIDPRLPVAAGRWLTSHLWYIRAYLWILLLTPILRRAARHLRLALPVLCAGVVVIDAVGRHPLALVGPGPVHAIVGDAVTYGTFVVLGMAYEARRPAFPARRLLAGTLVGGLATIGYVAAWGLPAGGVNDSYPLILLTGLAWLFLAGAAAPALRGLSVRSWIGRAVSAVNRRAVTIYLWHPAAIMLAYASLDHLRFVDQNRPLAVATVVIVTVGLTSLAAALAGGVEDWAARRSPAAQRARVVRRPRVWVPMITGMALTTVIVTLPLVPEPSAVASGAHHLERAPLPPPSYRPALTDSAFARAATAAGVRPVRLNAGQLPAERLQVLLDRWLADRPDVGSVAVAIDVDGQAWAGDAQHPGTAAPSRAKDAYGVASVTKTFTIALVLRAADQGLIDLDAPVPELPGLEPPADARSITPRQLLQHTSGLVDYPAARGYDPSRPLTPLEAVRLSLATPLQSAPGEGVYYANSNYQYVGLLLEHATGRPYTALVADLARSVKLHHTSVDASGGPGWIGFASGGIHSTVSDLARWGSALFIPGRVLPARLTAQLTTVGRYNTGLGTWPLCPCATDNQRQKRYTAIGQYTGHGGLYHSPEGLTIAVHMEPPIEAADAKSASLIQEVLRLLARS
jgi:CubicO group peptidase (beta-lactamase class C family)/peptidoglycan/LPS O-acetylase OafA/YrhL